MIILKLPLGGDGAPFFVFELTANDDDEVDDRPDAEAAGGDQHEKTGSNFSHIKTVDTKGAEKEAEKNGSNKTFRTFFHEIFSF